MNPHLAIVKLAPPPQRCMWQFRPGMLISCGSAHYEIRVEAVIPQQGILTARVERDLLAVPNAPLRERQGGEMRFVFDGVHADSQLWQSCNVFAGPLILWRCQGTLRLDRPSDKVHPATGLRIVPQVAESFLSHDYSRIWYQPFFVSQFELASSVTKPARFRHLIKQLCEKRLRGYTETFPAAEFHNVRHEFNRDAVDFIDRAAEEVNREARQEKPGLYKLLYYYYETARLLGKFESMNIPAKYMPGEGLES